MSAVLVTGATGFLGSEIVRRLLGRGREVHALARPSSDRSALRGHDVCWHEGDLADAASIERAVDATGADGAVVHCAAVISYRTRDAALQREVNVEGTRRVLEASRRGAVRRFLHVSSVVAIGFSRDPSVVLDETSPWNGHELRVDYATTKRAAEELVLAAASDLDVVVVNPGAIFGEARARSNTSRFLRAVRERRTGPLAPPGGFGVVGVGDAAEGTLLALERGRCGRRYALVESYWPAVDLFRATAQRMGVPGVRGSWPRAIWSLLEGGARVVDRARPLELLTPQALRIVGVHFRIDGSRARTELGWTPAPFAEVLDGLTAAPR